MGLDIIAYRDLTEIDGARLAHNSDEFAARSDDIDTGATYHAAEDYGFRAGSYSGYNEWREELAKLAGYEHVPYRDEGKTHSAGAWSQSSGPFWELIYFSDCEGTIGPKTSAKLAKDFADFQPKADQHPHDWFRNLYAHWRRAFDLAAQNGAVVFT
jgi:hypothetical protein